MRIVVRSENNPEKSGPPLPASLFSYDVIARLGEGAASVIYAVSDPRTRQVYALKHVVRRSEKDDRFIEQLENEYAVSCIFRHPLLRRSYDLRYSRTMLRKVVEAGLVMELVDGVPMDQQLPRDMRTAVSIFAQAARALAALHYLRYVHCDMKPHNILIIPDGKIKVVDFGQAARIGTAKKRVQGTPDFIAPEQVRCRPVTERTDIYSLGASLYWVLTGRRIPTLYTVDKHERKVLVEQDFPTPRQLNPATPEALSSLVMQCVRVHPLARPSDMTAVALQLEEILARL